MTRQEAIKMLIKMLGRLLLYCDECPHGDCEKCDEALTMAKKALQQESIIHCEECKHHGTSNCPMWGDDTTEDYMWCCDGERMESDEE